MKVQQLKQLSFSGLAAAMLLMVVPQEAFAMHIMEGFLPPMWALAPVAAIPAVVRTGAFAPHRGGRHQPESAAGAVWRVYFCLVGAENSLGDRQLFPSNWRGAGSDSVWSGRGGGPWCDCAAVPVRYCWRTAD